MADVKTRTLRVAQVIDDYKVVINRGADDGIKEGMRFLVYGIGDEVIDPETDEPLGRLELVRGKGKVIHVQPRFATIESIEQTRIPGANRRIRDPLRLFGYSSAALGSIEETDPDRYEDMPFENPQRGDQVKPI